MQAQTMPSCGVCLFVMFVNSAKTSNRILRLFSAYQTLWWYSNRASLNGGIECRWGRLKSQFSANIWLYDR